MPQIVHGCRRQEGIEAVLTEVGLFVEPRYARISAGTMSVRGSHTRAG